MYKVTNLSLILGGNEILKDVTFELKNNLNFIVGDSGSGKSTLLKVLIGQEKHYLGSALFDGKELRDMSRQEHLDYLRHDISYVGQESNLLENYTVLENLKMIEYLDGEKKTDDIDRALRIVKLVNLQDSLVSSLSGGEKQRVAIARALLARPKVFVADEPTSAIDKKNASLVLSALQALAKDICVIIVTHNRKEIPLDDCDIFELSDGKLAVLNQTQQKVSTEKKKKTKLEVSPPTTQKKKFTAISALNVFSYSAQIVRKDWKKFVLTFCVFALIGILLFGVFSGAFDSVQSSALAKLEREYGYGIRNISVVGNFQSASGTGGGSGGSNEVKQDISQVYGQYKNDNRLECLLYTVAVHNGEIPGGYEGPTITIPGITSNYKVKGSNSAPAFSTLVAGRVVNNGALEVMVSEELADSLGVSPSKLVGKGISFVSKNLKGLSNIKIVGVISSSEKYMDFEDNFIFSRKVLEMTFSKSEMDKKPFLLRAKSLAYVKDISDELIADGIVPLGEFTKVEDVLAMNQNTSNLGLILTVIIALIACGIAIAYEVIFALPRKRHYAVLQSVGYSKSNVIQLLSCEIFLQTICSIGVFLILSPLLNLVFKLLGISLFSISMIGIALAIAVGLALARLAITSLVICLGDSSKQLRSANKD
ncbi:MAG: ATP-binding cassette domain-containing protein [Clostridia bacterium]